jgi:hypothetical protein
VSGGSKYKNGYHNYAYEGIFMLEQKLGDACVPCDGSCPFKQKCREGLSCARVRSPGFHVRRATCQPG